MLKAFWALIQILLVCLFFLFLSEQKGSVHLEWRDYVLDINMGLFLVCFFGFLFIVLLIHKFAINIGDVPKTMRRYWTERSLKKSHISLTRSLVLLSAGDYKHAAYHAYRAQALLPEGFDGSAAGFIEAHSAQKAGQDKRARQNYQHLLENKESAFLGVQGLMQSEIEAGDFESSLRMAYRAKDMHPKQPWILKTVYDLEIKNGHWHKALLTLEKLKKAKGIDDEAYESDKKALFVVLSDEKTSIDPKGSDAYLKKALSVDPGFIPAAKRLALNYIELNKNKSAQKIVLKAWDTMPHPELVKIWTMLAPENKPNKSSLRLKWFEKLVARNPDAVEGQLAIAQIALDDGLWGEARSYLTQAEKIDANADVYKMWARLEELSTRNEEAVSAWLRKASDSKPSKKWVCKLTFRQYQQWYAIAEPHGSFNTIQWCNPLSVDDVDAKITFQAPSSGGFLSGSA